MNKFTITIELETYSDSPEDWITESIVDQLEDGEELVSLSIESSNWYCYSPRNCSIDVTPLKNTMTDTTYNGWTNYETWNVAIWLGNDAVLYT